MHRAVANGVATITLDSPSNRNALSARLRAELRTHVTASIEDDAVRVLSLEHTGPVFCSGMDLKESSSTSDDDQGVRDFPAILELLWTSPKPVVAKLAGPARAGGVGLVAACDIAVAAEDATFAFSEVRIGVVPAVISMTVLPRLNARQAHELFLTGERFDARRAERIGLVNSAVPTEQLDAEVRRYTDMLVRGGPNALAATKSMLQTPAGFSRAESYAELLDLSAKHFASDEGQEGMRAFAAKRSPAWVPEN